MNIMEYLKTQLKAAGRDTWPEIERITGVKEPLMRKVAYGNHNNPGVQKIQPLIDFFAAKEAPPEPVKPRRRKKAT